MKNHPHERVELVKLAGDLALENCENLFSFNMKLSSFLYINSLKKFNWTYERSEITSFMKATYLRLDEMNKQNANKEIYTYTFSSNDSFNYHFLKHYFWLNFIEKEKQEHAVIQYFNGDNKVGPYHYIAQANEYINNAERSEIIYESESKYIIRKNRLNVVFQEPNKLLTFYRDGNF